MLVDLGQAAAQGADGPLQRGVGADQGLVVGEVPHARAPVLQVDVAQAGAAAQQDFDRPAMEAAGLGRGAGRLGQHGRLGAVFQHDERVAQVDAVGRHGREDVQRPLDDHALGHDQQRAAGPAGGVQGGELVVERDRPPG